MDCSGPDLFLIEYILGDGYFVENEEGTYSIWVYLPGKEPIRTIERTKIVDGIVVFRSGQGIMFAPEKLQSELELKFRAVLKTKKGEVKDVGQTSFIFEGDDGPIALSEMAKERPVAAHTCTNVQFFEDMGSLQIYVRLTCYGSSLNVNVQGNDLFHKTLEKSVKSKTSIASAVETMLRNSKGKFIAMPRLRMDNVEMEDEKKPSGDAPPTQI